MKSIVKTIEFRKTYPTQHGDLDQYDVTFEGGGGGEVSAKTGNDAPWKVGEEADYTESKTQYGTKIKKAYVQGSGMGGKSGWQPPNLGSEKVKFAGFAGRWAVDYQLKMIELSLFEGNVEEPKIKALTQDQVKQVGVFYMDMLLHLSDYAKTKGVE